MEQAKKSPTFENVEIGEQFGPIEIIADDHFIKSYAYAIDDFNPWFFFDDNPFGFRITPSDAVINYLVTLFHQKYDYNSIVGIHQKEEVWYYNPIPFNKKLLLTGEYINKYTKRGKGYVVLEGQAQDDTGTVYIKQRSTEIMKVTEGFEFGTKKESNKKTESKKVKGYWPEDIKPVERVTKDIKVGTPINPMEKKLHQNQISVYSGAGDHKHNIHTDRDYAKKAGFKDTIAQGMMEACWLSELMCKFFGTNWLKSGFYSLYFLQPMYAGDKGSCKGVIRDIKKEDNSRSLEVEMWVNKQDSSMSAAGWAFCTVK